MSLVSIIVPIYNIEPYLNKCIDSILGQHFTDTEIILVDDGSTDSSPRICDEYAKYDERVKVIHKENGGLVSARKAGIIAAAGKYVLCVDGDDYILPDYLDNMMSIMEKENADIVTSGYFNDREKGFDYFPSGVYKTDKEKEVLYKNMLSVEHSFSFGVLPFVWGKLFRRELLKKAQMKVDNRITVGEDVACVYPAMLSAGKIVITRLCGCYYRIREDSLTRKSKNLSDEDIYHLAMRYKHLKKEFKGFCKYSDILEQQLNRYFHIALVTKHPDTMFSDDGKTYLPYGINKGENVVLYGTGAFGRTIEKILTENGFCNVKYRTQKDAYGKEGLYTVNRLLLKDYDRIVVSVIRKDYIDEITDWLALLDIPEEKISYINLSEDACSASAQILERIVRVGGISG